MAWLIEEKVRRELRDLARAMSQITPSAEMLAASARERERERSASADDCYILSRAGSEAVIVIRGVLMNSVPYWMEYSYGRCTSYIQIQRALSIANDDPSIKKIVLDMESPGGNVMGLFETLAAIQAVSKPMVTRSPYACSAAYAIAAVAGRIEAKTAASMFGSIGVAADFVFWDDVEEISLTNTDSPDKRPDVHTDEGKAIVVAELDAINDLFVEAIAAGRALQTGKKVPVTEVRDNYGRGATLLAVEARKRGMIDTVLSKPMVRSVSRPRAAGEREEQDDAPETPSTEAVDTDTPPAAPPVVAAPVAPPAPAAAAPTTPSATAPVQTTPALEQPAPPAAAAPAKTEPAAASGNKTAAGGQEGKRRMDIKTLKEAHPEVYAAILKEGEGIGHAAGVATERKRCNAHAKLGKQTGAIDLAFKCIAEGQSTMDEDVHADYLSASMNRSEQTARQTESNAAETVTAGTPAAGAVATTTPAPDAGDAIVAKMKSKDAA